MKLINTLGCTDKPCDCGCKDCGDSKPAIKSKNNQDLPLVQSVQAGYRKPSAEDYVASDQNINTAHKAETPVPPSGFNKKEIVKTEPAPKLLYIPKKTSVEAEKGDHTGVYIMGVGIGFLLLLILGSRDEREKK